MGKQVHDGHRARMRERILANGVESLEPHETLEYMLYSFVPRRDTNEIAHALIDEFGSLAGVLNADYEHLKNVSGVTANAAEFLSALPGIFRKYMSEVESERLNLGNKGKVRAYLGSKLYGVPVEEVCALALDVHGNLLKYENISKGSAGEVGFEVRAVVEFALKYKACGIVIAHNHPSGNPSPSYADKVATRDVLWGLDSVGVTLCDHYIFSASEYYSFEENGKLQPMLEARKNTLKEGFSFYE